MERNKRLTIDRLNERGCINILCAMVKQMRKDFVSSYRDHLSDPADKELEQQYEDIKEEFLSGYFLDLTRLDGKYIVKRLKAMVEQDIEQCA